MDREPHARSSRLTDQRITAAAVKMVEGYRARQANTRSLGHNVGSRCTMSAVCRRTFEPGRIFISFSV
jgi:hypothetical protein